jgi:ribose transport system ATP-binding protein
MADPVLLSMRGIDKRFGGVHALRHADFDLRAGEVHALLGENGAGKSTLMNILSGVVAPDAGELRLDGTPVQLDSPRRAQSLGIATIFQELDLVPGLSVAANMFLGKELMRPGGMLDGRRMQRAAQAQLHAAGIDVDAGRAVADLSIGQRQLVAIAKALAHATRILIMDEPTAALTATEAERLFAVVRALREKQVGIIYISHRLEEVPRVADRVTVMRDGRVVGQLPADARQAELVELLVGRKLTDLFPPHARRRGEELLRLQEARYRPARPPSGWTAPDGVTLTVHAGEIVGLAGIMGAGRTELLTALYGAAPRGQWEGRVEVSGRPADIGSCTRARRAGLAFVTDDRRGSGLMLRLPVGRNLVLSILASLSPFGVMSPGREAGVVARAVRRFDIRPPRGDIPVGNLSGGNQQKVVLGREILGGPRLLLLDEPTRGVDVGAKGEIYQQLRGLAEQGLGVLVASSELPELVGLCDRVVVMRGGRSVAEFAGTIDEHAVLREATGGTWGTA